LIIRIQDNISSEFQGLVVVIVIVGGGDWYNMPIFVLQGTNNLTTLVMDSTPLSFAESLLCHHSFRHL
jgi:hypothetical protein